MEKHLSAHRAFPSIHSGLTEVLPCSSQLFQFDWMWSRLHSKACTHTSSPPSMPSMLLGMRTRVACCDSAWQQISSTETLQTLRHTARHHPRPR